MFSKCIIARRSHSVARLHLLLDAKADAIQPDLEGVLQPFTLLLSRLYNLRFHYLLPLQEVFAHGVNFLDQLHPQPLA